MFRKKQWESFGVGISFLVQHYSMQVVAPRPKISYENALKKVCYLQHLTIYLISSQLRMNFRTVLMSTTKQLQAICLYGRVACDMWALSISHREITSTGILIIKPFWHHIWTLPLEKKLFPFEKHVALLTRQYDFRL